MEGQLLINTYCDRPWTELHIEEDGSVTPCCVMPSNRFPMGGNLKEYITGKELKDLKTSLQSGIKHKNCEWCWKNEKSGLKTHRIKTKRPEGISSIHLRLSNVCNFKCRMCNPSFSSTWVQENKKHKWFRYLDNQVIKDTLKNTDYLFPLLKDQITKKNLNLISISGGEPLITDSHYQLLDFLIKNNLTDVDLSYSTNLSNFTYKNRDLLALWSKFRRVSLEASIDGWGPAFEYSRTGFDLDTFKNNFRLSLKHITAINCVVNVYSVWTLPEIERFRKFGINIVYSPCYLPEYCNPQILNYEDKQTLKKLYEPFPELCSLYEKFIDKNLEESYNLEIGDNVLRSVKGESTETMVNYNLLLDSYRNTSFFDVFPMYKKYLRS